MNKAILMGRLTRDPEVRYSQAAEPMAICRYSLAVNRRFKREGQPDADFINCVAFGKTGEFAEKYFKKGMMVAVEGSIQTSSWDDKETGQKRYGTDIIVEQQHFAESRASFENRGSSGMDSMGSAYSSGGSSPSSQPKKEPSGFTPVAEDIDDDDLPF